MKKIKKSKDANVGIIAIIIIVIIAIIGIIYFVNSGEAYWETDASFGSWAEGITIYYADGTSQSLKLILDGKTSINPFVVTYNGQEIRRIKYWIDATTSGTGYTGADIDINNLDISYRISYGDEIKEQQTKSYSGVISCPLDTVTEIANRILTTDFLEDNPPSMCPDGDYKFEFVPSGSVKYKGTPGGDWQSVSLPSGKYIIVTLSRTPNMGIIVTLNDDISAYY